TSEIKDEFFGVEVAIHDYVENYHHIRPEKVGSLHSPAGQVFNMWRRCSVFLLHEHNQHQTPLPPPPGISSQIENLQNSLQSFLDHFVEDESQVQINMNQREYLTWVIREGVAFGYMLISQACNWRLLFDVEQEMSETEIMTMPGLVRLSLPDGKIIDPVVVIPPTTWSGVGKWGPPHVV
ncbi:hypothetical protein B0T21DRAFT_374487, partial [Apiosordaria backusii]